MDTNENLTGSKLENFNEVVVGIAKTVGTVTGSLSEFGQLVPLMEIAVTAGVFWRYGGHIEVVMGVFFAQLIALYLVNHYANTAMTTIGQYAIYASILVGAVNTGFAISYGLNGGGGLDGFMADFVGLASAVSIVLSYIAKIGTHEAAARRIALKAIGDAKLAEIKRNARHEAATAANLNTMQLARLNLQSTATVELTNDDRMKTIQRRALAGLLVGDILKTSGIHPNSKLAKDLIKAAADIAQSDDLELPEAAQGANGTGGRGDDFLPLTTGGEHPAAAVSGD